MAAIPNDSLLYYEGGQLKKISSTSSIEITDGFTAGSLTTAGTVSGASGTFSGNVAVTGNLTVTGKVTSADRVNVALGDSYIDLLASNTVTGSAAAGGMTVNIEAQTSTFSATAFTAGVVTTGPQPYITVSTDPTGDFSPDDIIQVSGTKNGQNDGLYVVESLTATQIRIKGIGTVPVSAQTPFIQNDFTTTTAETTAIVVGAKISVWTVSNGALYKAGPAVISAGTWAYHTGTTDTAFINSWNALTAVTQSLQAAYNGGPSITLSGTNDLVVSLGLLSTAKFLIRAATGSKISAPDLNIGDDPTDNTVFVGNVKLQGAESITSSSGNNPSSLTEGAVVYRNASNDLSAADSTLQVRVIGTVGPAPLNGEVQGVYGTPVTVQYVGGAPAVGAQMYLSATAGAAQSGPPSSGRIYFLGTCIVNLGGGLATIDWTPQYIADV